MYMYLESFQDHYDFSERTGFEILCVTHCFRLITDSDSGMILDYPKCIQ